LCGHPSVRPSVRSGAARAAGVPSAAALRPARSASGCSNLPARSTRHGPGGDSPPQPVAYLEAAATALGPLASCLRRVQPPVIRTRNAFSTLLPSLLADI